jgi:DNA-binding transcriptional LysR family regulator
MGNYGVAAPEFAADGRGAERPTVNTEPPYPRPRTPVGRNFVRADQRGTRPTIAGQEFLDAARRIIEDTESMIARLKTSSRGQSGRLTIGVHASLSAGNLRATLVEYRRRFPSVDIHLVDGSSEHLISDLSSSALDVAFVAEGQSKWNGRLLDVWSERLVLALPEDLKLPRFGGVFEGFVDYAGAMAASAVASKSMGDR